MEKELNLLYVELLKFPDSPKIYRDLQAYYFKNNKELEAKAFSEILTTRFNEIPVLYDISSNNNQK